MQDKEWSKYQKDIFNFIEHEQGHLIVEAVAGSGKTTTILKCLDLIPNTNKILFSAFNQDIVKELKKKIGKKDNVDVRTLHSLGLDMLKKNYYGKKIEIEPYKYESHIKANLKTYTLINTFSLSGREYYRYLDNIKKYIDFGRFYLCQTVKDLDFIEERYGIDTIADEKDIAIEVMEWGKNNIETVDYTDMVWLPNTLFLKPIGHLYDFIFIDECQDMNKAERELVLKCFKMGTRMVSVGDEKQCIYSFSGSDTDSFQILANMPNTTRLPLSVSYRCSRNIVDYAKRLVPSIEANNDGREGKILYDVPLNAINDGDMILCRNNAPLLQIYSTFLKMNKKAYIRGKEIGTNLKSVVKSTYQEKLNVDCREDGVFARLYDDIFSTRNKLMDRLGIDASAAMKSPQITNKLDIVKALEILAEGLITSDEIINKIDAIFKDKSKDGIALSTVHKAKGLEANNVFIACNSLMPSKSATKDWEIRQEYNLMYVAYTRAKNTLGFIDEKDFEDFDFANVNTEKRLQHIEEMTNKALNKSTKIIINKTNAVNIVNNAQKLDKNIFNNTSVNINNKRKVNSFLDLLKNKKINKKSKLC